MALDEVLLDLEVQDYATGTVILPACSQNALHRRDRVWIIARNVGNSDSKRCQGQQVCVQQGRQDQTRFETSWAGPDVAHSKCQSVRDKGSGQDASETRSLQGELRERQRIWTDPSECSTDVAHSDITGTRLETHQSCGQGWQSARASQSTVLSQGDRSSCPEGSGASGKDVAHSEYKGSQRGVSGGQNPQWKGQHGHTRCCSSSDIQPRENPSIVESRMGISIDGLSEGLDMPRRWGDGSWEDGIPRVTTQKKGRTQRLRGLGNAIVPQVAYEIIRHFD